MSTRGWPKGVTPWTNQAFIAPGENDFGTPKGLFKGAGEEILVDRPSRRVYGAGR